ncbi:MAG: hypothetical protein AB8F95_07930, partial [Bacteroidia bacterium]
ATHGRGIYTSECFRELPLFLTIYAGLEGPFDAGSQTMNTAIANNGDLPNAQPYNTAPWHYTGNEVLDPSIPLTDIVDWVLIELREIPNDPATMVSRRAAVLMTDGIILDVNVNGGGPNTHVNMCLPTVDVHVVIHHRNHLSIASLDPIPAFTTNMDLDFRNIPGSPSPAAIFVDPTNPNPPVRTLGGWELMVAGDATSDNQVNSIDLGAIISLPNSSNGYLWEDINLNGIVEYPPISSPNDIDLAFVNYFWSSHVK